MSSRVRISKTWKYKYFHCKNGRIIPRKFPQRQRKTNLDWLGCKICERWFHGVTPLENHYSMEHKNETSFKFELVETRTRTCVVCVNRIPHYRPLLEERKFPWDNTRTGFVEDASANEGANSTFGTNGKCFEEAFSWKTKVERKTSKKKLVCAVTSTRITRSNVLKNKEADSIKESN